MQEFEPELGHRISKHQITYVKKLQTVILKRTIPEQRLLAQLIRLAASS